MGRERQFAALGSGRTTRVWRRTSAPEWTSHS